MNTLFRQPLTQDCVSQMLSDDVVDFELSFEDEKPAGQQLGPEIRHSYDWDVRLGVLWR